MIIDTIENASKYAVLSEGLKKGIDYLQSTDFGKLEPGKYELGDGLTAIVNNYDTKYEDDGVIEAHKKHIDIQYIIAGEERMGYLPLRDEKPSISYSDENDVMFFNEAVSYTCFTKGMFAIFFPEDIHQPGICMEKPAPVKKLVIKIPV